MKFILMITFLVAAIIIGCLPRLDKPHSIFWKLLVIISVFALALITLIPPTTASFDYAVELSKNNYYKPVHISLDNNKITDINKESDGTWLLKYKSEKYNLFYRGKTLPGYVQLNNKQNTGDDINVVELKYDPAISKFELLALVSSNPVMTFPFIADLQERIRILSFHVPMSWVAVLAYLISMIFSIRYLKSKNYDNDIVATSSAGLGIIFTVLATTTGMVWAKFNWGSFWNWDPRQTSIFVLFLIYAAYFALRSAIDNEETKARLSAVYSILAFITVPFLVFILPRLMTGLHPGSQSDSNVGPILSTQANMLDSAMSISFSLGLAAFTLVFFWLLNLSIRAKKAEMNLIIT